MKSFVIKLTKPNQLEFWLRKKRVSWTLVGCLESKLRRVQSKYVKSTPLLRHLFLRSLSNNVGNIWHWELATFARFPFRLRRAGCFDSPRNTSWHATRMCHMLSSHYSFFFFL